MAPSQRAPDVEAIEDHELQYGHGPTTEEELDEKYPGRPRNFARTLPFHDLYLSLFNPLNDNKTRPSGPSVSRAKKGPHGPAHLSPHEARRNIIERFISRWRNEVGNDFYPALRLILPEKDRDRAMYGLKEKAIGKLIVKMLRINAASDDGQSLLNWKLPGQTIVSRMAGDFAGRCYEVLSKRAMRTEPGDMRIAEVNSLLDRLSVVSKEEDQLPIFNTFYERMNADELLWLIRIILRQMKVGASEKTFLDLWHPDGEALFNVSSSLRRVCWELIDPTTRLEDEEKGITLMNCFQPQLAQFQTHSFQKMIDKMGITEDNPEFWIEEKLDGERMQLHMRENEDIPGGREFKFWSRKGKDYTYLYGTGFKDENSSLTRFIENAFDPRVKNIILDGEMITWDPETDAMVGFGTLKTAALGQQRNPHEVAGQRPLFRVFDCLYLNDENLTRYELKDRREALNGAVRDVHRRLEIHKYQKAYSANEIDPALRKIVAEASEGLVLKNPKSIYRLNSRNDDWMKVKPEYMSEFGESLDCVVIGGYYGSGHRGGRLSSFLCGLRVGKNQIDEGADPMKCYSFFKVGGGFRAEDYAELKHLTDSKWIPWDPLHPPTSLIRLGGQDRGFQYEKPDLWIKPSDSVVLEVKAASVGASDQFGTGLTLRFPRFKKLKRDKNWEQALSIDEFMILKANAERETKEKEFKVETKRKATKRMKKELVIAGNDTKTQVIQTPYAAAAAAAADSKSELQNLFQGLNFCVLTEMLIPPSIPSTSPLKPLKKKTSKLEIETMIKSHGGVIYQSPPTSSSSSSSPPPCLIVADKRVVKVASLMKSEKSEIVRPKWIYECVFQAERDFHLGRGEGERFILPWEMGHLFYCRERAKESVEASVDCFGDSYCRDVEKGELRGLVGEIVLPKWEAGRGFEKESFLGVLEERGKGMEGLVGRVFGRCGVRFFPDDEAHQRDVDLKILRWRVLFGGGRVVDAAGDGEGEEDGITHFVVLDEGKEVVGKVREMMAGWKGKLPRIVGVKWLRDCWEEKTLLDEEQYVV